MNYICSLNALVLELVDKRDLKSLALKRAYGFDPRPEHKRLTTVSLLCFIPLLQISRLRSR